MKNWFTFSQSAAVGVRQQVVDHVVDVQVREAQRRVVVVQLQRADARGVGAEGEHQDVAHEPHVLVDVLRDAVGAGAACRACRASAASLAAGRVLPAWSIRCSTSRTRVRYSSSRRWSDRADLPCAGPLASSSTASSTLLSPGRPRRGTGGRRPGPGTAPAASAWSASSTRCASCRSSSSSCGSPRSTARSPAPGSAPWSDRPCRWARTWSQLTPERISPPGARVRR